MCQFNKAKLGDRVSFWANCVCKKCGVDNSRYVSGTYLCHQDGYDIVDLDNEYACPSCGNVHKQMWTPCDAATSLANIAYYVNMARNGHKVTE